jgi:hypothetical protein
MQSRAERRARFDLNQKTLVFDRGAMNREITAAVEPCRPARRI